MRPVKWVTNEGEVYNAEWILRVRGKIVVLYMQVESLGESGWDWHIWEQSGLRLQRYGLADTLAEAMARAEGALDTLTRELG